MEVTLSQLSERWNNIVWGMDPYKGGDVPLLKIAEEDFEALEVCSSNAEISHSLQLYLQLIKCHRPLSSTAARHWSGRFSPLTIVRQIQWAAAEM